MNVNTIEDLANLFAHDVESMMEGGLNMDCQLEARDIELFDPGEYVEQAVRAAFSLDVAGWVLLHQMDSDPVEAECIILNLQGESDGMLDPSWRKQWLAEYLGIANHPEDVEALLSMEYDGIDREAPCGHHVADGLYRMVNGEAFSWDRSLITCICECDCTHCSGW